MNNRIARNLAEIAPGTLFIGIDIGKRKHQVSIMTEHARVAARFKIDSSRGGFEYLLEQARHHKENLGCRALLFGGEPSGHYWRPLAYFLEESGQTFRLVNSFSVKRFREGMDLARTKNDRRDADTIADMLRSGRFIHTVLPHGVHAELRHSYRHYCRFRSELTRKRNLLIVATDSLFPEFKQVFKGILGRTALAVLRACPAPAVIKKLSAEQWETLVGAHYQGKRFQEKKKVRLIYQLANESIGIPVEGRSRLREISFLLDDIKNINAHMEALERDMMFYLHRVKGYESLLSIQGIGLIFAAGILAEIGDINNFSRIKGPVKLAGINPSENQSSDFRGRSVMTKKGRATFRTAVYLAAVGLVRSNKAFRAYYQGLRNREIRPLSKMKAIGAVMNKLVRVVYALLKKGELFDPRMICVEGQPKEVVLQVA